MDAEDVGKDMHTEFTVPTPTYSVPQAGREVWPFYERLITLARIRPGQYVLDLVCGTGHSINPLQEYVGPNGFVLGLDMTADMVNFARDRAKREHISNIEFALVERETRLAVPAASFDSAICVFGLTYIPDLAAVLRAVRHILKPEGHLAVCTWATLGRRSPPTVPLEVVRRHLEHPLLDVIGPEPVALPTTQVLASVLTVAGFTEIEVDTLEVSFELGTPEEHWSRVLLTEWPLVMLWPSLSEEVRRSIHEDALQTLGVMFPDGPVRLTGEVLLAAGITSS